MDRELESGVEELLLRADRRVLHVLAPVPRCVVMALRMLRGGPRRPSEVEAQAEGYGVRCTRIVRALDFMQRLGLVECRAGVCGLTEEGEALAATLIDFLENVRSFAYKALEGSIDDGDVLGELVTATASAVGLVEAYLEDPVSLGLYLVLHLYLSGITAVVLAELVRLRPELQLMLESVLSYGQHDA